MFIVQTVVSWDLKKRKISMRECWEYWLVQVDVEEAIGEICNSVLPTYSIEAD